ncbi:alpha/beta hydrolase [Amycolatopsis sp. ATCC 39116]|uniref:alpha/beta hydrolase n=1 Tax=Amycolatopsis sp. (strain ATCC 39116 / 75iv2) TaxID=385957 RepID=UPI000262597A|nr:alpha/beta hydrolase [Amycolatopsis sp. ATCC 39116]
MSSEQLEQLKKNLREGPLDIGGPVAETRRMFEAIHADLPVPDDVRLSETRLGAVPALAAEPAGAARDAAILYLHGGAYVVGSSRSARAVVAALAAQAGCRAVAADYRLAPEHPFPAAVGDALAAYRALLDQGIDPGRLALAGDSAGGGLAIATLVAARDEGLPLPAAAAVFSPWADLTLSAGSLISKADADPALTARSLSTRAADYLGGQDPRTPLASPVFADLTGLPPLLIQAGTAEILLDDAVGLAAAAARADVDVDLQIRAEMPHVWQTFAAFLDEGRQALTAAAAFLVSRFD